MPYRHPPEFRRRVLDLLAAGRSVASLSEDFGCRVRRSTTGDVRTGLTAVCEASGHLAQ